MTTYTAIVSDTWSRCTRVSIIITLLLLIVFVEIQ